jgi:ketosteroid isomerase-like protein
MTTNAERAATLTKALRAGIDRDGATLREVYTEDVRGWTPAQAAASFSELVDAIERRDDAFSDMALEVFPLDVGGDYACAEWRVTMTHTGPLELREGTVIAPTGLRVRVDGTTVAEFHGDRICSFRQYWDAFGVLEQLGLLGEPPDGPDAAPA